jgi:ribosomal protein S18 acetylase RimI-like enzyme
MISAVFVIARRFPPPRQTIDFNLHEALSSGELKAKQDLKTNMAALDTLYLGVFHGQTLVGWSFGQQADDEIFYMINSAIFPAYRLQGLYRALVETVISEADRAVTRGGGVRGT